MKLDIIQGDLKQGYFWQISKDEEVIALGYYRLKNSAEFYGNLAMSIYNKKITA